MKTIRVVTAILITIALASLIGCASGNSNNQGQSSAEQAASASGQSASSVAQPEASAQAASSSAAQDASSSDNQATSSSTAQPETTQLPEKFVILHTNDVHGYLSPSDDCLGLAAVAQLKADYLAQGYDVLLLDAGDVLQGNMLVGFNKGEDVPALMETAGYDVMALGNHEFDYGADVLQQRMEISRDFALAKPL